MLTTLDDTVDDRNTVVIGAAEGPKGDVVIGIPLRPVRFKASRARKQELTDLIKEQTSRQAFLLSGEVKVDIEWMIHEQDRHESARSPDIDNILKPILDALQGVDGVMFNDAQIQEISCRWIDWTSREQRLDLRIRYIEDEWIKKEGLTFVRMTRTLCMPLNRMLPAAALLSILDVWEKQFNTRERLLSTTYDYYEANSVMPIQRPFHISRARGFAIVSLEQIRRDLLRELQSVNR